MSTPDRHPAGFERMLRNAVRTELTARMRHGLLHDLKGPGQIILSALHMLQKNAATADAATLQKYCDWIRDAVKDIAARAEKILPAVPTAAASPETCDLAALNEDVVHLLRDDSALKGVIFQVETQGALPAVSGLIADLRLALQALLFGVLDRIPENSTACIRLAVSNGQVEWSVTVPGGEQPDASAFEARYDRVPPASGIGWHVARSIIRERGGDITLAEVEKDWQVVMRLPLSPSL